MRQALHADSSDLERMGRAGRRAVEAGHRASEEARKLARVFGAPATTRPQPVEVHA
jgi:hypothetical protein